MAQRQWRSDDTDTWLEKFGDGSDGSLTISANTTDAPIDAGCSGTAGTTSLSATNASFATGQIILIHQTRGTNAGSWELNKISSYSTGTITTAYNLCNTYSSTGASKAQVIVLERNTNVTINSSVTLTGKTWDGTVGGVTVILASNTVTINGTITLSGKGFRGGQNRALEGEGTDGASDSTYHDSPNGNGGGSGANDTYGGGGGGNGTAGSTTGGGDGGNQVGNASLTLCDLGGGGGGGGDYGPGGNGAGILIIIAKNITGTSGIISLVGSSGTNTTYTAGGSGSGGSFLLKGETINLSSITTTATGGAQVTNGIGGSRSGGAGGTGRIHVDYSVSFSGTTTPTINQTNDTTITSITYVPRIFLIN